MNASEFQIRHIDAHTHVQFGEFDADRDEVFNRARSEGVAVVMAGSTWRDSLNGVEIAKKYNSGMYACVGLHPGHSYDSIYGKREVFDVERYKALAQERCVVGIGECGLDYFKLEENSEETKRLQKDVLLQHIYIAKEVSKPLVIHCREAYNDLYDFFVTHKNEIVRAPLMHFFAGSIDDARKFLDIGFYFTFGGVITFLPKKNSLPPYDEVIKFIPIDRILPETDAPDVAPVPFRGKRNEPVYVLEVEKRIAELKGVSQDVYAIQAVENAKKLFGI